MTLMKVIASMRNLNRYKLQDFAVLVITKIMKEKKV
jgi:hypothetical protein